MSLIKRNCYHFKMYNMYVIHNEGLIYVEWTKNTADEVEKMKENENLCMLTRHNLSHPHDSDSRFEYLFCTVSYKEVRN